MTSSHQISRRRFLKTSGIGLSTFVFTSGFRTFNTSVAMDTRISILYNNTPHDGRLEPKWGFSALIEQNGISFLWDVGGESNTLLDNMEILDIDTATIHKIAISHAHWDHLGGLEGLLDTGVEPTLYIPPSFPQDIKTELSAMVDVVEVSAGLVMADNLISTGEMTVPGSDDLVEHALIVRTGSGMAVITGCAHPGIVRLVARAKELVDEPVLLVAGGFHLGGRPRQEIIEIADELKQLGVLRCAPSHCTGEEQIEWFKEAFGEDFVSSALGCRIEL